MELELKSIGKVESANIIAESISVIAGYNGSGKTTISKSLYGMLDFIRGGKVDADSAKVYFDSLFSSQMITAGRFNSASSIRLYDRESSIGFTLDESNGISIKSSGSLSFPQAVYLRSPSRWSDSFSDKLRDLLSRPTIKTNDILNDYIDILEKNAKGHLKFNKDSYMYVDEDFPEYEINIDNTASGVMIFLELSRLIANGTIVPGSVLIIDEPDSNLHPEKQIALARVLVDIAEKLGIRLLLTSHNIYFIRALEISLSESGLSQYRFYTMKQNEKTRLYSSVDVSDDTEEIYSELYKPLEEL